MPPKKLSPKERELACQAAMEAAAEIINEVCKSEGSRVVAITDKGVKLSFAVPPEVVEKNPVTVEDLMTIPWSRNWSEAVLRMSYGPDVWARLPEAEKTERMRSLIERKLLPALA